MYQGQTPIDVRKLMINILNQSSVKVSNLKFTDLCPLHVTNRNRAALVLDICLSKYLANYVLIYIITIWYILFYFKRTE